MRRGCLDSARKSDVSLGLATKPTGSNQPKLEVEKVKVTV